MRSILVGESDTMLPCIFFKNPRYIHYMYTFFLPLKVRFQIVGRKIWPESRRNLFGNCEQTRGTKIGVSSRLPGFSEYPV